MDTAIDTDRRTRTNPIRHWVDWWVATGHNTKPITKYIPEVKGLRPVARGNERATVAGRATCLR